MGDNRKIRAVSGGVDPGDESAQRSSFRRRLGKGLAVVLVLLAAVYGALLAMAGGWDLLMEAASIKPHLLALPVIATLLSYLTMSRSYEGILRNRN